MATVPTVTQRSVLPSGGNLPYGNPNEGYASNYTNKALIGLGNQISQATDEFTTAMDKLQAEDDKREFRKLDTEYSAYVRTITYGDGTAANPGFMNQRGENAISAYPNAQKALQKKQDDLLK